MPAAPESDQPLSVGDYLRDWLELQRTRLQPSTVKSYSGNLRRYLEPHLGDVPLHELGVLQLERLWTRLMACGGEGGRPLSRRSVEYAAATLRSALSDAVRTGLVDRNVAKLARLPTVDPGLDDAGGELQVWTAEQARRFLDETRGDRLHDAWLLALGTGMRRGELLGLRWEDVDLDARILHVRRALQVVDGQARLKATKTLRSRSIRIDVNVVEVLRRRRRQRQLHQETAGGGDGWHDRWGLVFTEEDGNYLVPMNVTAAFRWRVRRVDVPTIRLHDLRHTHATLLLEAGVPVTVVSERLGHSSVSMTLDVYAHVLPAMEADAVKRFAVHLYGG